MSKRSHPSLKIRKWLKELNDSFLLQRAEKVECTKCNKFTPCVRKSQLVQHIASQLHTTKTATCSKGESSSGDGNFFFELCEALVSANIPWNALNNAKLKSFLQKYAKRNIPDESLVVGNMVEDTPSIPHLIACEEISEVTSSVVARFVHNNLRRIGTDGVENKVILFLTDAASYMIAAGKELKLLYSKMMHVTCLAHGLHRLAETIRLSFPMVNKYITVVKDIFLKSPSRIYLYKTTLSILLPPEPVLTRCGTWINAVVFNATHFEGIKKVIDMLNEKYSESIRVAKELVQQSELTEGLTFIKEKLEKLPTILKCLEARGLPLSTSLKYMEDALDIVKNVNGVLRETLTVKIGKILQRNVYFTSVVEINELLEKADSVEIEDEQIKKSSMRH